MVTSNDAVLESIDSCVACAEGADVQHQYEQKIFEDHLTSKQHGLSEKEAAVIRRQLLAVEKKSGGIFLDVDDLNLCGSSEELEHAALDRCVVCLEQPKGSNVYADMPCCQEQKLGHESATGNDICTACVLLLCSPTSDGESRVGRCLGCRQWLAVRTTADATITIEVIDKEGPCGVCNQTKSHLVEQSSEAGTVCDACFLGKRRALLYECKECHCHQRIPHPLYRYQLPSVNDYGDVSWACQLECQRFTKWKIVPDQAK